MKTGGGASAMGNKTAATKRKVRLYRPALLRCPPTRADLVGDLFSGVLVGIVALPLAIAFAIASGAPPMAGIVTGILAGMIIAVGGGSRFQIGGPTGAFVGLCAAVVAHHGLSGLALATLMAGALLVVMGLLRFGAIIRFIPAPVITGFTTGIAVLIAATQLRDALGITEWPAQPPVHFHERLAAVVQGLGSWSPAAGSLCAGTVVVTILFRRVAPRWPGALIAIGLAAGATYVLGLDVETIGMRFGALDGALVLPSLDVFAGLPLDGMSEVLHSLIDLSGPALAIAILAAIESLLSATVADQMGRDRHDPDSELIGQGIANLIVPWFGGIPATGAIARTATSIRSGARTPLAGIIHALTLLIIAVAAMPLVAYLPMSALAGVLFVVAWYMSEFTHWPHMLRSGTSEAFLLVVTYLLTVLVDLTVAIEVGVILGLFFFVRRLMAHSEVRSLRTEPDDDLKEFGTIDETIEILEIGGPFFFGMAVHLRDLTEGLIPPHRVLIIRMRSVPFVDTTAAAALRDMIGDSQRRGCQVILSGVSHRCRQDLARARVLDLIGGVNVASCLEDALTRAHAIVGGAAA